MAEITAIDIREILIGFQGQEITLEKIRSELQVERGTRSFDAVRNIVFQLAEQGVVRYVSRGNYKVIKPVKAVQVYGTQRERRPLYPLIFPRDFDTGMEMDFAEHLIIREGDLITLGGVKSKGKTTICLNLIAENIDKNPLLMGNEYTVMGENGEYEPSPRWLNRMDTMSEWIQWTDVNGMDRFELLPVTEDYVEHMKSHRFTLIDWVNLDGGRLYDIGKILEGLKNKSGRGVTVVAIQKGEGVGNPRGGQFVRDFSDLEILLDGFGNNEDDIMLTIKGAKEKTAPIVGKRYAYTIAGGGTKIINFREIKKCPKCYGKGYGKGGECEDCFDRGWIDK